jgi:hypothetical protein
LFGQEDKGPATTAATLITASVLQIVGIKGETANRKHVEKWLCIRGGSLLILLLPSKNKSRGH